VGVGARDVLQWQTPALKLPLEAVVDRCEKICGNFKAVQLVGNLINYITARMSLYIKGYLRHLTRLIFNDTIVCSIL
jgi:hypothetical protein